MFLLDKKLLLFLVVLHNASQILSQTKEEDQECKGTVAFEKAAFRRLSDTSPAKEAGHVLYQEPSTALTAECIRICKLHQDCTAFDMDYANSTCTSFNYQPQNTTDNEEMPLLTAFETVNFFEKVCYSNLTKDALEEACGPARLWTMEVVIGGFLEEAFSTLQIDNLTRAGCSTACLMEKNFFCRSATYDLRQATCQLSSEGRQTQRQAYREHQADKVYLENQCFRPGKLKKVRGNLEKSSFERD